MLRNTQTRWGSIAKCFHWTVAIFIFVEFVLGWTAVSLPLSPAKLNLFVWHKSIGLLVLLIVMLRLGWRLAGPVPQPPITMPRWQQTASLADHWLQYALMLLLPFSGWIIDSAANIPFRAFWLFSPPRLIGPSKLLEEFGKQAHLILSIGLAGVIVIHVVAALWHHFVARDNVLRRMLAEGNGTA